MEARPTSSSDSSPVPLLEVNSPMQWTYYYDFLVAWEDPQTQQRRYLGKLDSTECEPRADWCLVLGQNTEGKEFMMSIHLPLKLSPKSKHSGDIYWVLPIESLDAGASALEHEEAELTLDGNKPGDPDRKVEADVVRVHLEFMKPGYVLMPVPEAQKPLKGRPLQLLSSLKSLSRTRSFDLYLPDSDDAGFMDTQFRRLSGGSLSTPEISHKSTFSGRKWGRDAWEAYGLQDDDVIGESPPLYEEVVSPDPSRKETPPCGMAKTNYARKSPWLSPHKASTNANAGTEDASLRKITSEDIDTDNSAEGDATITAPMNWLLEYWPQFTKSCSLPDTDSHWGSDDPEEEGHRQAKGEYRDHSKENGEAPSYGQDHGTGLLPFPEDAEDEQLRKRKAREALSDSDSSSGPPGRSVRKTRTTRERKRVAKEEENTAREQPQMSIELSTTPESERIPLRRFIQEGLKFNSRSIFCDGPNNVLFDSTQYCWFIELVVWMRDLWHTQSNFHEAYLKELRTLCEAIKARDRHTFETTLLQCMSSFVRGDRRSIPLPKGPLEFPVEGRLEYIIKFLYYHIAPGADGLAANELLALHRTALAWKSVGGEDRPKLQRDREWQVRARSFSTQMCACVLVALYRSIF